MAGSFRIGFGYDIHPLVEGRPLILGGVRIRSKLGLDGHSDADVLCHAVGEALLGAAGLGDLGRHFPPSNPRYKNISSLTLLKEIRSKLQRRGWMIQQVDSTVVLQLPRLATRLNAMRSTLARTLAMKRTDINVKAKSPEWLGPEGELRASSAFAVALLKCPPA
ncbi:MAG: 2-C-methyl-D-erythritol 2,4-cyclodiphosphate synthase [Nitrospirae bacterium]|nr:2-C-methyl-D-erythritol 2,4-cyclodiphosphate synthase [Nitrospirota bacterium]